jgi:hypothetical protein
MKHKTLNSLLLLLGIVSIPAWSAVNAPKQPLQMGPQSGGGYSVATGQLVHPAGKTIVFAGRPVDQVLVNKTKTLYIKDNWGLVVLDTLKWKILQEINYPEGGGSMHGIVATRDGSRIYSTTASNILWEAKVNPDHTISWGQKIVLPGPDGNVKNAACLWGLALSPDEKTAVVCLSILPLSLFNLTIIGDNK